MKLSEIIKEGLEPNRILVSGDLKLNIEIDKSDYTEASDILDNIKIELNIPNTEITVFEFEEKSVEVVNESNVEVLNKPIIDSVDEITELIENSSTVSEMNDSEYIIFMELLIDRLNRKLNDTRNELYQENEEE